MKTYTTIMQFEENKKGKQAEKKKVGVEFLTHQNQNPLGSGDWEASVQTCPKANSQGQLCKRCDKARNTPPHPSQLLGGTSPCSEILHAEGMGEGVQD